MPPEKCEMNFHTSGLYARWYLRLDCPVCIASGMAAERLVLTACVPCTNSLLTNSIICPSCLWKGPGKDVLKISADAPVVGGYWTNGETDEDEDEDDD